MKGAMRDSRFEIHGAYPASRIPYPDLRVAPVSLAPPVSPFPLVMKISGWNYSL
jgi:hypothetical protein